jgi:hypothetical protein
MATERGTPPPEGAPSGMPDEDVAEETPLGVPDDKSEQDKGAEAMPGIPTEGEPPTGG